MTDTIAAQIGHAFHRPPRLKPFRHFLLNGILPLPIIYELASFDWAGDALGDGGGKRETQNDRRAFLAPNSQFGAVGTAVALAFQRPATVSALSQRCAADLDGTMLRIEYCRDKDGFWLEPHTDIAAKRLTILIYLNDPPPDEEWGTDLYLPDAVHAGTTPSRANAGLAFVPGADTWHGFAPRKITGVRRSLIINYVDPAWRARHELAFPAMPVRQM